MSTIMSEIIFEVSEDEIDGGYSANALGYGIHTEGETLEELRQNVKEAVECYFDETMKRPKLIRLHLRCLYFNTSGHEVTQHDISKTVDQQVEWRRSRWRKMN